MSIGRFVFLIALVASAGPSSGQSLSDQFHEKLQTCRNFISSDTRLDCYDAANRQYLDRLMHVVSEDEAEIREIWKSYAVARVDGNAEAWLALWDESGVQMPPGMPARSKEVLIRDIPKTFEVEPASYMEITPDESIIIGEWAFSRGNFIAALSSQGNAANVDGKFMTVFRRQDDGSWKIYRHIMNSNQ